MDQIERLLDRAIERRLNAPRTIGAWVGNQTEDGLAWSGAVDAAACAAGCGGQDGIAISVSEPRVYDTEIPSTHRILIGTFEHHAGRCTGHVLMSAEQAKALVNRLGEAIAAAERVDAGV